MYEVNHSSSIKFSGVVQKDPYTKTVEAQKWLSDKDVVTLETIQHYHQYFPFPLARLVSCYH